jgi:predicted RNase H-related nuclease YkuK (DUF458 family)
MKTSWKTLNGERIEDIVAWVDAAVTGDQIIHVGTDSLQTGRWTQFVTVVVILNPPKGGRVAYIREVVLRMSSLRQRLTKETWMSVELGLQLPKLPVIHIDANHQERHRSSKYLEELVGMVVGQGFKALYKPESWAATHCADHVVRHKGLLPKGVDRRTPRGRRTA